MSLIVSELEKAFSDLSFDAYSDIYPEKPEQVIIDYDLEFINRLI
jgi:hypothetical protein